MNETDELQEILQKLDGLRGSDKLTRKASMELDTAFDSVSDALFYEGIIINEEIHEPSNHEQFEEDHKNSNVLRYNRG